MKEFNHQQVVAGFTYSGPGQICASCIADTHLAQHVNDHGSAGTCYFCGDESGPVLWLDDLFLEMASCIRAEFTPASLSTEVPGPEWDIDVSSVSSAELLSMLGDPLGFGHQADIFCEAFDEDWIPQGVWAGTMDEWLSSGWERFANKVKTSNRFIFLHPATKEKHTGATDIDPTEMLDRLADVIDRCEAVIPYPAGQPAYRGRKHGPNETPTTPEELGAPPPGKSGAQRMSPPGIAFFYAATDDKTALAELRGLDGEFATVAQWVTCRHTHVLDLVRLRDVPSIFDRENAGLRPELRFLHRFSDEISKPVRAHDNPQVDYVPTQIVAEYLRHCVTKFDEPVEGMIYSSAVETGRSNIVFFVGQDQDLLRMVPPPQTFEATAIRTEWKAVPPKDDKSESL